jgi:two-component system cell cycle response regulator
VKLLTTLHAAIRISVIIMIAEILIMLMLQSIPNSMSLYEIAILDAVLLVLLSIPPIYIWVVKPYFEARAKTLVQLRNMSLTDPLTKLASRRLVEENLDRVVAGCTRHQEYCAVMLINLDHFNLINERFGYDAGNAVLIEVARRLHSTIRSNDIVGRMGGDEFIVLLERLETDTGVTGDRVLQIANKLIKLINMPIAVNSKGLHVSASVGIRLLGFEQINTATVISEADSAMYRAKEAGGGRAVIF